MIWDFTGQVGALGQLTVHALHVQYAMLGSTGLLGVLVTMGPWIVSALNALRVLLVFTDQVDVLGQQIASALRVQYAVLDITPKIAEMVVQVFALNAQTLLCKFSICIGIKFK